MARPRFWDPEGRRFGGIPTYPWRMAPAGLLTRRQLRARGLRPGGQQVAAQLMWRSRRSTNGVRVAYLYRLTHARPVRPMTDGRRRALAAANTARRTCPTCGRDAGYVLPAHLGTCLPCAGPAALAA
ncbi:RRQRL motif-containing zinc-binding protein [Kitasatospora sp. NPDC093550]|uniref:RRQRL motif-containing zinc-binding protein n=1 Tax=Kitasatospora sp. NPDC093550 TaxID=3364089 RepID=UPI0038238E9B